jgi:hypothetical protein
MPGKHLPFLANKNNENGEREKKSLSINLPKKGANSHHL